MRFQILSSALLTLALTSRVASAEEIVAPEPEVPQSAPEQRSYVPVNLAFVPRVELNAGYTRPTNTLSLGILGGSAASTRGLALSAVAQLNSEDVRGAQISGVFNVAGDDVTGVQLGGVVNVATRATRGAQVAGVVNVASEVRGLQLSGVVNVARKVKGIQIGVVNVADEVDGASIGLVNIVRRNGLRNVGVWGSDTSTLNIGTRLGTETFYTILSAGARPLDDEEAQYSVGAGFGTRARLQDGVSLGVELQTFSFAEGSSWDDTDDQLQKLSVMVNWTLEPRLTVFGGPALNVLYSGDGRDLSDVGTMAGFDRIDLDGDASLELGLGFVAGVQLL